MVGSDGSCPSGTAAYTGSFGLKEIEMAKGRIRVIENIDRKFGEHAPYLFLKVQADYSASAEEYLLMTESEFEKTKARAEANPEDVEGLSRGSLTVRIHQSRKFGSPLNYFALRVVRDRKPYDLLMTVDDIEGIRWRVENNEEDIEANKEGWLADLLD